MMWRTVTGAALLSVAAACILAGKLQAQISPGELSAAHAGLEGLGKCTSCHALGKAVDDGRCLSCHVELDRRVRAGRGYHANLKGQSCVQCHKEHHGRDFALVRWEVRAFDHHATGFDLQGKHRELECRKCHSPEKIKESDVAASRIVDRARTYLGLSRECASCHNDPHGGMLGTQCLKCHGSDAWKPAAGFSHDRTRFPLTGKHQTVGCELCHGRPGVRGVPVRYTGLRFGACVDCHRDPHAGKFQQPCEKCHTTAGWEAGSRNFDHASTRFPLRGRHALVECARCHTPSNSVRGASSRFAIARFSRCMDCHPDPHGDQLAPGKSRQGCDGCHNEKGWKPAVLPGFDHDTTRFPLLGKHASVACALCHVPQKQYPASIRRVDMKSFSRCIDCHADAHAGQFNDRPDGGSCDTCHRETGFRPSTFLLPAHEGTRFPLEGAHRAVSCDRCHSVTVINGTETRLFRWVKVPVCETCHSDQHRGEFSSLKVDGCASCHTSQSWTSLEYDHTRVGFRLEGRHRFVPCTGCHRVEKQGGRWRFRGTPTECVGCHTNVREG